MLVFSKNHYDNKIINAHAKAKIEFKENIKKEQKDEAEKQALKLAEEKAAYDKHKGEKLIYSPMGDSLAFGVGVTNENKKYVSLLAQQINKKLGYEVEVSEGAVFPGKGLKDEGIPNLPNVIAEQPDFVTIEFGTNDLNENNKNSYSSPQEFKEQLEYLIDTLKDESAKPLKILLVTTWNSGQKSLAYDYVIASVAKEKNIPVANIQSVWQNRTDTFGPKGYEDFTGALSDGWHPNDQGHEEIAKLMFDKTYDILK